MNIVAIGDVILDNYHKDNSKLGYYLGGSILNDLINLSEDKNNNLYLIGSIGKENTTSNLIDLIRSFNIDTSLLKTINKPIKRFHITLHENNNATSLSCPSCEKPSWHTSPKLSSFSKTDLKELDPGILIIDSVKKDTLRLANEFKENSWFLAGDIGYISHLRYASKDAISMLFQNTFDFLQITEKVAKFLCKKFNLNELELFNFLGVKYLNITKAEKDAGIFYLKEQETQYFSIPAVSTNLVDTSGAGDVFFSTFIKYLAKNQLSNETMTKVAKEAAENSAKIISCIGATGSLIDQPLDCSSDACSICGLNKIEKIAKPKILKTTSNVNNLLPRLLKVDNLDTVFEIQKLITNIKRQKDNVAIVGTGGSFISAHFIAKLLSQELAKPIIALKPRDIFIYPIKNINFAILLTYSGKTPDILTVNDYLKKNNIKSYIVTNQKKDNPEENIISYNSSRTEKGFLAVAGTVIPIYLFAKSCLKEINLKDFVENSITKWKSELSFENLNLKIADKPLLIDIFSDYETGTAALDLESKFVESGFGRVTIHDKKDFSHGRFNIISSFKPDLIIFLDSKGSGKYNEKLYKYLTKEDVSIIHLKTNESGILADLDLLIASQFLIQSISEIIKRDLTKPDYPKRAMSLYRYKDQSIL